MLLFFVASIAQIFIDDDNFHLYISHFFIIHGKGIADTVRCTAIITTVSAVGAATAFVTVTFYILGSSYISSPCNGFLQ